MSDTNLRSQTKSAIKSQFTAVALAVGAASGLGACSYSQTSTNPYGQTTTTSTSVGYYAVPYTAAVNPYGYNVAYAGTPYVYRQNYYWDPVYDYYYQPRYRGGPLVVVTPPVIRFGGHRGGGRHWNHLTDDPVDTFLQLQKGKLDLPQGLVKSSSEQPKLPGSAPEILLQRPAANNNLDVLYQLKAKAG